jgi:RNase H-fold protein (predicted Holliday junction resolvase)
MSRILGLDVSTKTIGISLFEVLTHITPKVKPKPKDNIELLIKKAQIFQNEFLEKYSDIEIDRVIIEEPLVRSNNVNTVATLLRFNGMICRSVYEVLNLVPEFISSYDARKFAFPELMEIRKINKKGEPYTEKEIERKQPVLFGGHPFDIDKKQIIWEKVNEREPQIVWVYDKHQRLSKENFDMTDAYACVLGQMRKEDKWT